LEGEARQAVDLARAIEHIAAWAYSVSGRNPQKAYEGSPGAGSVTPDHFSVRLMIWKESEEAQDEAAIIVSSAVFLLSGWR